MALTPEQIKDEASHHGFIGNTDQLVKFARAIESEVRKDYDALILQLVEALERSSPHTDHEYRFKPKDWMKRRAEAIQAGRARLGEKEASTALSDAGIKVS